MLSSLTSSTPNRSRRGAAEALLAAGLFAGLLFSSDSDATPAPFTFMAPNPGWIAATNGGLPIIDPEGDTPGPRDIVGDAANPMLFIASDAAHLYFRLRVDSDPAQNPTNFTPFGWGCFINTDSNLQTYEFSTHINGVSNPDELNFYKNTMTASPNDPNEGPDMPALETVPGPLASAIGHAQVVSAPSMFGGNADFFIQWAVELPTALAAGFDPAQPANYYCGSSNNGTNIEADCSGAAAGGCPLDSEFSDPIACGPLGCSLCGDGMVSGSEGCDDGNQTSGDGCNNACLKELGQTCAGNAVCASGFCDPAGNVCACDQDSDCPGSALCDTVPDPNVCVGAICGNGSIEAGEGCDDQNTSAGDGCSAACAVEPNWTCAGEPSVCDLAPCTGDADCTFCNEQYNLCMPACLLPSDCPSGLFCDTTSAICVPLCLVGSECPSGHCDAVTGQCVECLVDADCPIGELCQNGVCGAGCTQDADCSSGLLCDEPNGICVECLVTSDCAGGLTCVDQHCLPACNEEADCTGIPCNETVGLCVECLQDSDCPDGQVCDEPNNTCVGCTQDSDCSSEQVCDEPNNTCVGCLQDSDCANGQVCDEPAQACVECLQDADCPNGEVCDEAAKTCVECTQDAECPTGLTCNVSIGQCITLGCVQDPDCPSGTFCDEGPGVCVECTRDSECAEGLVCNEAAKECVECTADVECGEGGTCDLASFTCNEAEPAGVVAEGSGLLCATRRQGEGDGKLTLTVLGLLGLVLARRRRREDRPSLPR